MRYRGLQLLSLILLLAGCSYLEYHEKPIASPEPLEKFELKTLNAEVFLTYLREHGIEHPPFTSWHLKPLTLTAWFYHPELKVAKAQLGLAQSNLDLSMIRKPLGSNASIARSNQANGDINPWAYAIDFSIPLDTQNKRSIQSQEAQAMLEASRMDLAEMAWKIHSRIKNHWLDYQASHNKLAQLEYQLQLYTKLLSLYEDRMALGYSSSIEFARIQMAHQQAQITLEQHKQTIPELRAQLASDVGLTENQFNQIPIEPAELDLWMKRQQQALTIPLNNLQQEALLNRIDVRRSLAQYAAAEARLRLEVAKQIPDITLSPGITYEFGDFIWSLGIANWIQQLQLQPALIRQAERLREVEGAQFETLQANIIGDLQIGIAQLKAAQSAWEQLNRIYNAQTVFLAKQHDQFEAGLIDRVALVTAEINRNETALSLVDAKVNVLKKQLWVENCLQRPLLDSESYIKQ